MKQSKSLSKIIILSVSIVLLFIIVFSCYAFIVPKTEPYEKVAFTIYAGNSTHNISLYKDEDKCYLFLPSYVNPRDLKLEGDSAKNVLFNGEKTDINSFSNVEMNKEYSLTAWGKTYPLFFMRSANVRTLYMDTQTIEGMKRVNEDKSHEEKVRLSMVDKSGAVTYDSGGYIDTIKGHGNSTWGYQKKPYNLTLNEPAKLLDGNANQKFVLLANAFDKSNLRNKLVYDMAQEVYSTWNPSAEYVDLFVNNEYRGLYLLTDKIEVTENKFNLDHDSMFFTFELDSRAEGFYVPSIMPNISAELAAGAYTKDEQNAAEKQIRAIFNGLNNDTIENDKLQEYFDLDSWASQYIIQEFTSNYDAGKCSLYFYLKDGKLYAGPIWDYDNAFGLRYTYQPNGFCAKVTNQSPFWAMMMRYDAFNNKVNTLYKDLFKPKFEDIYNNKYTAMAQSIKTANKADHLRWRNLLYANAQKQYLFDFKEFIKIKLDFLDSAWLSGEKYHNVYVETGNNSGGEVVFFTVKDNDNAEALQTMLINCLPDKDIDSFYNKDTGEKFDFSKPINKETNIIYKGNSTAVSTTNGLLLKLSAHMDLVYTAFFCFMFGVIGLVLLIADIRQNKKG